MSPPNRWGATGGRALGALVALAVAAVVLHPPAGFRGARVHLRGLATAPDAETGAADRAADAAESSERQAARSGYGRAPRWIPRPARVGDRVAIAIPGEDRVHGTLSVAALDRPEGLIAALGGKREGEPGDHAGGNAGGADASERVDPAGSGSIQLDGVERRRGRWRISFTLPAPGDRQPARRLLLPIPAEDRREISLRLRDHRLGSCATPRIWLVDRGSPAGRGRMLLALLALAIAIAVLASVIPWSRRSERPGGPGAGARGAASRWAAGGVAALAAVLVAPALGGRVVIVAPLATVLAAGCVAAGLGAGVVALVATARQARTAPSDEARSRARERLAWGILLVAVPAIYSANFRQKSAVDCVPARYLAISIAREGNLDLDEFPAMAGVDPLPGPVRQVDGHTISKYPPGSALFAVPVFAIPAWLGLDPDGDAAARLAKLAAVLCATLASALLFRALRSRLALRGSVALALAHALGTGTWCTSSQDLWQHGPAQLCVVAALALHAGAPARGDGAPHRRRLAATGLALGMAIVVRPADALLLAGAAFGLLALRAPAKRWDAVCDAGALLAGAALPVAGLLAQQTLAFGSPFASGYGRELEGWNAPLGEGLFGVLFSPSRGLFAASPYLLFSLWGWVRALRQRDGLLAGLGIGAAGLAVLHGMWPEWWGGWSYGHRFLLDAAPALVLLIAPATGVVEGSPSLRVCWRAALAWSVAVQALGAFAYDDGWNRRSEPSFAARDTTPLWEVTDGQIAHTLRHALGQE